MFYYNDPIFCAFIFSHFFSGLIWQTAVLTEKEQLLYPWSIWNRHLQLLQTGDKQNPSKKSCPDQPEICRATLGSWEHVLVESYGCGHHMELKAYICLYCCCSEKKLSFLCTQWTCVHVSDGKIWGGRIFFCASHITFGRRREQRTVILCGSLDKEPLGEDGLSLGRQTRWTLCTPKSI